MLRGEMNRRRFALGGAASLGGLGLVQFAPLGLARLATAAEAPGPIVPRRLFFEDPERTRLRISPNGTRLAWLAPADGILNLWVAPVDDIAQARPVTRATDRAISSFYAWAWTDRHLVFFREHDGDENWRAASVDVETGVTVPLTPERGVRSWFQAASPQRPTEMLLSHNARDKSFFDAYLVDIVTGRSSLALENREFVRLFADSALDVRFGARTRRDGSSEIMQRTDGGWKSFAEIPIEDREATWLAAIPPERDAVYLVDSRGRDKGALFEVDLTTGSRQLLVEDGEADVSDVLVHPGTDRPIAAMAKAAKSRWHVVDARFREDFAAMERFAGRGELGFRGLSRDGRRFAAFVDRDDASGEFVLYDGGNRKSRSLFRTRPKLDTVALRPMLPVSMPARDGLVIPGYLTLPEDGFRNGALVLVIHGGPYWRDSWGFNSVHQWLANRGYAVLSVNYRGSTGFGKAFVTAADREWGGRMHDDLIDAVEWAVAAGHADRARVGFMGASYGGYAALTAATKTPEVFACIVDIFGISNLITFMQTIPPYWEPWFPVWKRRLADPATEEGKAWLKARSPLTHVGRIVRPLLIGQGMNDVRVVAAESEQIVRAMQARGIPVTYVTFPDEGHGFARPQNRLAFNAIVEQFLAKHLGGRAEPVGDAFAGSSLKIEVGRELVPGLG
jgi:dipeptidyl aminopeptidase/acylaminoacyl peptidase